MLRRLTFFSFLFLLVWESTVWNQAILNVCMRAKLYNHRELQKGFRAPIHDQTQSYDCVWSDQLPWERTTEIAYCLATPTATGCIRPHRMTESDSWSEPLGGFSLYQTVTIVCFLCGWQLPWGSAWSLQAGDGTTVGVSSHLSLTDHHWWGSERWPSRPHHV